MKKCSPYLDHRVHDRCLLILPCDFLQNTFLSAGQLTGVCKALSDGLTIWLSVLKACVITNPKGEHNCSSNIIKGLIKQKNKSGVIIVASLRLLIHGLSESQTYVCMLVIKIRLFRFIKSTFR